MTETPSFDLGQPVTFTHILGRTERFDEAQRVVVRRWDPLPRCGEGLVVGKRTKSNGHVDRDTDWDEWTGRTYTIKTWVGAFYFTAYLVAFDLRQNPVWVLPEHLSPKEEK